MTRWRDTLLGRLVPPLAVAIAIFTIVVTLVATQIMGRAVRTRAESRAAHLSILERDVIERLMRAGDHRDLQHVLEQVGRNPDVAVLRLLTADGRVHASSAGSEVGRRFPDHLQQHDAAGDFRSAPPDVGADAIIHTVQPIRNSSDCRPCHGGASALLAVLDLDVAVNPHATGRLAFRSLSAALGGLYLLAAIGIAVPVLDRVALRPLRRLTRAMERVEGGDLPSALAASGTREIDGVIGGFNRMVDRLRRAHRAEAEAHRLQMERVEQLATVGELAAGFAHEIRNPLSSVKAVVEVLATTETLDGNKRAVLRETVGELTRIDRIVRDLLQYARPKPPSLAPFNLNTTAGEAASFTLTPSIANGVSVAFKLAPDLPAVFGDAEMVRQVLVNLLLNAQQASPPHTPGELSIATGVSGGMAWCRIRDFGPGVPAERADAIFRPFVTTKTRGTGLGLSISRRLIELQGGRLTLDNPGEPGGAFTFTLPLAPAESQPPWPPTES